MLKKVARILAAGPGEAAAQFCALRLVEYREVAMNPQNVALALAIASRLTAVAHRAMKEGRDVTDEELDAAMSRSDSATDRLEDLAEEDGLDDNPTTIHSDEGTDDA